MREYQEWRRILKDERLPAVVVDLDAFDRNIRALAGHLQGTSKALRIATKSVRVPELLRRALAHGAPYKGLMCYSAEEAAFLAGEGFDDFLVAYPTVQPSDLKALRGLHDQGKTVRLVLDSEAHLAAVAAAMKGSSRPFPVVIDLDASLRLLGGAAHLGVRRSPVRTESDLAHLLEKAKAYPELRVVGAMAYEAQVAGLGDRNPFKTLMNPAFKLVRWLSVRALVKNRRRFAGVFREKGVALELFNGGGTGSMNYAAAEAALTELSAGSALLCSHLFDYYSNVHFEPAAFFALQAVRSSDPGCVTCQGGGYIASGEPGWDKVPLPYLPEGSRLVGAEACGEVQTPVRLPPGTGISPGDPVLFRHAKAGELAERFNEYLLVSDGRIVSRAKTYRGLGKCFF